MAVTVLPPPAETLTRINRIFKAQQAHQYEVARTTLRQRKAKLRKLLDAVMRYRTEIQEALYLDFRKHPAEVDLTEIYAVTGEIKHTIRHLHKWMRPERVRTPIAFLGSRSWIKYEPKGVVLIISPWNFPVNLTFGPLVSALAAGNCVMIKPSEHTPHTSALMSKIVGELFDEKEVAMIEGAIPESQALLKLPFNHIFFTGAPSIGKIVMEAASKHLTSVTLELGGKSPTIVDETAPLEKAISRIAWGKFANNGQICIAPDYLFVHEKVADKFVEGVKRKVKEFYGENPQEANAYNRMVNNRHFHRVKEAMEDAIAKGAKIDMGGLTDNKDDYIHPTMMTNVPMDSILMEEEIFGPVLPVYTFKSLDEPLKIINSKEKPLALYIYSKSRKNIDYVINNTRAGGTCINHTAVHFYNNNLPFGGSNNSGIGKGHGIHGFKAYSNPRGVFKQVLPLSPLDLLTPPYTDFKQKLIDLTIKYF